MTGTLLKLALFFAVCTVLTAYLAFTIGNIHLFQHTYTLNATFDSADGLLRDDNVKVAGVVVGKVTDIKIEQGRAKVSVSVKDSVKVPTDSSIAIRWRNLIGQRYVYLYPGTGSTVLEDGATVINTRSVVDVGELFNKLGPILKAVDPKQVNTFLDANVNTVAGTINDRDAQIRLALDNLVLISQTFSQNTDVLNNAVTELGDYTDNFGALLANNRVQLDHIVTNLNTLTDEVKLKLPVLDSILGELDEAAKRLAANRYGEWLNNNVLCGALFNPARIAANDPCVSSLGSLQSSGPQSQAARESRGAVAVNQLLAGALPG
jgi:phospholipid/cholesterol/gamma-HCH transport system substrate-binding protein